MWKLLLLLVVAYVVAASQAATSFASADSSASTNASGTSATAGSTSGASDDTPSNSAPSSSGSNTNGSPSSSDDGQNDSSESSCPEALERYRQAVIANTGNLLKSVVPMSKDGVYIYSPLSAMDVLSVLAMYAEGQTYAELAKSLGFKSKDEIQCVLTAELALYLNQPKGITYSYAVVNAGDYKYNFTNQFKNVVMSLADSTYAINAGFNRITTVKTQINNLITSATGVKNAVSKLSKNGLNVILGQYFAGSFEMPFNLNNITAAPFYGLNNKTCNVNYFYQRGTYNYTYSECLQAKLVSIPYVEGYFEALFMIPTEEGGYVALAEKLASCPECYQEAYNNMTETPLDLYLPVYGNQSSMVSTRDLVMKTTGIKTVFSKNAQFKNMIVGDVPISDQVLTQKYVFNNIFESSDNSMDCGCPDDTSDTEYCEVIANQLSLIYIIRAGFPVFCTYGNLPCVS